MPDARCAVCGAANPNMVQRRDGRLVCRHLRACEGRMMLKRGEPMAEAAAHAQGLSLECADYLRSAAAALDCAVQLCGDLELAREIDGLERRCDELARQASDV
jgi:hypothetical protein